MMLPPMRSSVNLALLAVGVALPAAAQISPPLSTERLEGIVRPLVARNDFAGAIAITQDGRALFGNSWGKADLATARAHTPATRYQLGPLSQQFTAALILDLSADGYLTVDDQLSRWLPGIRWASLVTIRDLLGHRGGVPRDFPAGPDGKELLHTDADRYGWLSSIEQVGGRPYAYSNVGYWLLAQVAARAAEGSFPSILRSRILEPNGLRTIDVDDGSHSIADLVTGYEPSGMTGLLPRAPEATGGRLGTSGVVASVADLLTWTTLLHSGRLIPRPLLAAMVDERWGGLEEQTRAGRRAIGSAGTGPGYAVSADWYPAEKVTIVMLANTRTGGAEQLREAIPASLFGLPVTAITIHAAGPAVRPEWLQEYVGSYRDSAGRRITVRPEETGMQLGITGDAPTDIYPLGDEAWFQRATYAQIQFLRDAGGRVKRLRWTRTGTSVEFSRE